MLRVVEIRNSSARPVEIAEGYVVPPHGKLTVRHSDYIAMARDVDLASLPISVVMPDLQLRRVTVREFGARGDGMTDDTYAMQSAIDSVASLGGGVVELPIGVYVTTGVVLHGEVSLEGEATDGSVLKGSGEGAVLSASGGRCVVSNLTIIGGE